MKPSELHTRSLGRVRRNLVLCLGVFIAALMTLPATAQTFSASIAGTVTDSSAAIVRGTKLQLENTATHDTRLQTSNEDGTYTFSNLLPGTYRLTATASGFKEFVRSDMELRANTAATVNVALQVGQTSEQVVVSADSGLMDTESSNNSVTLDQVLLEIYPTTPEIRSTSCSIWRERTRRRAA